MVVLVTPPNRTTVWRTGSYSIACAVRAPGPLGTGSGVQLLPSHDHASWKPPYGPPPNTITRCRTTSYARACARRGGGKVTGTVEVQLEPSHSHVSPSGPAPDTPPNRTVRMRALS